MPSERLMSRGLPGQLSERHGSDAEIGGGAESTIAQLLVSLLFSEHLRRGAIRPIPHPLHQPGSSPHSRLFPDALASAASSTAAPQAPLLPPPPPPGQAEPPLLLRPSPQEPEAPPIFAPLPLHRSQRPCREWTSLPARQPQLQATPTAGLRIHQPTATTYPLPPLLQAPPQLARGPQARLFPAQGLPAQQRQSAAHSHHLRTHLLQPSRPRAHHDGG